ncbi:hypothetical protein Bhyg_09853, partial [Pseudolycoriella hygida]
AAIERESKTESKAESKTFKCGNLECPNGSICEIKRKPNDDQKSVKITTKCVDSKGSVLNEEKISETVPDGKIPISSIKRTSQGADVDGSYFESSYSASSGSIINKNGTKIEFDSIDVEDDKSKGDTSFKDIWSVFDEKLFKKMLKRLHKLFSDW